MIDAAVTIRPDTAERHKHKYHNGNALHRAMLKRFFDLVAREVARLECATTLDFGCGEAFFWQEVRNRVDLAGNITGIDLRAEALSIATQTHPEIMFLQQDILLWEPQHKSELVVASQVLEHLVDPGRFLGRLCEVSSRYLLLTVPWEPLFMLCNLARGRDLMRFGNHPEHINHWGRRSFEAFVSEHAHIEKSIACFPFLIIVARPLLRHDQ